MSEKSIKPKWELAAGEYINASSSLVSPTGDMFNLNNVPQIESALRQINSYNHALEGSSAIYMAEREDLIKRLDAQNEEIHNLQSKLEEECGECECQCEEYEPRTWPEVFYAFANGAGYLLGIAVVVLSVNVTDIIKAVKGAPASITQQIK